MDFQVKNFEYVRMPFGDFIKAIEADEKLYLRSLSAEKPSEIPAKLSYDFSAIANDFKLPSELSFVTENPHSSPLRISGPVNMWLHYDVSLSSGCAVILV
jgi:tRNA wybutosine-synthesizing protein 4